MTLTGSVSDPISDDRDEDGVGDACQSGSFVLAGGSCAAAPSGGGATWIWLLLVLGGLLLARRGRLSRALPPLLVLGLLAGSLPAQAQTMIDVQRFKPSPFWQDGFGVGSGDTDSPYRWNVGGYLHYQNDPLVLRSTRSDGVVRTIVAHQVMADLLGAYRITDWFSVGAALPLVLFQSGNTYGGTNEPSVAGLGDLRVYPRFRLLRLGEGLFSMSLTPMVTVSTGRLFNRYTGSPNVSFQPTLAMSTDLGRVGFSFDVGYVLTRLQ